MAVAFGETFEALVAGVQGALWALGGVPAVLRNDNLSAATHELKRSTGRDLTVRFRAVLAVAIPIVHIPRPDLRVYDTLLTGAVA